MSYKTLRHCIDDLERTGQLVRIEQPVDARLEAAEIQRRVFRAGGPAIYFANVKGCRFPMVSNLFGTMDRVRYIFRDSLDALRRLVELQADPADLLRSEPPGLSWGRALRGDKPRGSLALLKTSLSAWYARPKRVKTGPVLANETTVDQLPQLVSWPADGGAYITLPQVYTEDPDAPGFDRANLGMYRVQLSGGSYEPGRELGLHYQIHRGIGVHHAAAIRRGELLRVNVFIGGPPAMTVAAVMPLPEGTSELALAGVLNRRRVPMICRGVAGGRVAGGKAAGGAPAVPGHRSALPRPPNKLPIHAEADFCITGYLDPNKQKPEGPFGDHLGYYSLAHDFPVMRVEHVYHRTGAIWPFTVVGRPPQEDSMFGRLIHELVGSVLPKTLPGVRAVNAVDAAGVHPLLLAVGSERYVPYEQRRRPRELLTLANALLGQGQLSLAKYLMIAADEDSPGLDVNDVPEFLRHVLERIDWRRDLHFHTCTTIDTLDYSGGGLNSGSKVVMAAAGPVLRKLPVAIDSRITMPKELGFKNPRVVLPGILVVEGPAYKPGNNRTDPAMERFCAAYRRTNAIGGFPLVVVVDHSGFVAQTLENFLWTTFTRSNPASDIYGVESFILEKHWGCFGSLVIDARAKPHHAPPVVEDPAVTRRVDELCRGLGVGG